MQTLGSKPLCASPVVGTGHETNIRYQGKSANSVCMPCEGTYAFVLFPQFDGFIRRALRASQVDGITPKVKRDIPVRYRSSPRANTAQTDAS